MVGAGREGRRRRPAVPPGSSEDARRAAAGPAESQEPGELGGLGHAGTGRSRFVGRLVGQGAPYVDQAGADAPAPPVWGAFGSGQPVLLRLAETLVLQHAGG